ncbi:HEPN domain-containing protein [Nocardia blacklockiae]|uniref:HEPN domain-containing protein n=1 Tax=Nocardia blacklockiae TaxID=480036 RepID=UPI0018940277|nr:HEPN domain-containing protein [Nocardia blacklockiae]MBF6172544.1 hypothetical protein [Nocardia blacklockiae]
MNYTFRHRFKIVRGNHLDVKAETYVLADSDLEGKVSLRSTISGRNIDELSDLAVQGIGYDSVDDAICAGRRWKRYLLKVFARQIIAVDFGEDDSPVFSEGFIVSAYVPFPFGEISISEGDRLIVDSDQLQVFRTEPFPKFINSTAGAKVAVGIRQFETLLRDIRRSDVTTWSVKRDLAYRLVHDALWDENPEVRYILLVTAVEALLVGRTVEPDILAGLDRLKRLVKAWTDGEPSVKKRLLDLLREDKRESISKLATEKAEILDGEYGGMEPVAYFKDAYNIRSNLVHGNTKRPSYGELRARDSELLRFVLDLLDADEAGKERPVL